MRLMLDGRQRLTSWKDGDVIVTHEPAEYPDHVAEKLLQLRRKGLPLVVEAAPEEVHVPMSMTPPAPDKGEPKKRTKAKTASADE